MVMPRFPTTLRVAPPTLEPGPVLLHQLAELSASSSPAVRTARHAAVRALAGVATVAVIGGTTWVAGAATGPGHGTRHAERSSTSSPGVASSGEAAVGTPQPDGATSAPDSPWSPGLSGAPSSQRPDRVRPHLRTHTGSTRHEAGEQAHGNGHAHGHDTTPPGHAYGHDKTPPGHETTPPGHAYGHDKTPPGHDDDHGDNHGDDHGKGHGHGQGHHDGAPGGQQHGHAHGHHGAKKSDHHPKRRGHP